METIVLIVHVLVAAGVIGLILIQQGKGAEAGASFGAGASQTVFGSQGSASFLSRTTAILATVFFLTSFGLAMVARQKADAVSGAGIPAVVVEETVSGDAPISAEKNTVETDAPVIESQPVKSDEESK
ncbi:preprotein translocase subunit SecG [Endozoicomonas sp. Mp262]|uniref:preprotein translocase subunit SecG n=1 Tax=Endozoicomonas sp. Mp262 TaxID=2919499 RepID=UPI0021D90E9B